MIKMEKLFAKQLLTAQGWQQDGVLTLAEDGSIASIAPGSAKDADVAYDCLLPGMPNLHSHAFQRAMAGLTEVAAPGARENFWSWREVMYRIASAMTPDQLYDIACYVYMEMLQAGYTSVAEFHYLHHQPSGAAYANAAEMSDAIVRAGEDVGLAVTLLPVLYMTSHFGGAPATSGQQRFVHSVEDYLKLLEQLKLRTPIGVAFHSLRAVPPEAMREALEALPALGLEHAPIHIHIAEQQKEVADCLAWSGRRPVAWLLDNMPVDKRWCLVHATHMDAEEISTLAKRGAVAGLCPTTEANLGDGIFPAEAYCRQQDGAWGIGSDSHISVNPWEEIRLLEYGQRLQLHQRAVLAGDDCLSVGRYGYERAVEGGARACGHAMSGIAPGAPANLVAIECTHPLLCHKQGDALLDSLMFAVNPVPVQDVYVRGRRVIEQGHHTRESEIAQAFGEVLRQLYDLS